MTTERVIRPLLYSRLRLYLGGMAEYVGALLDEELEASYTELEQMRAEHKPEPEIEAAKDEIIHIINARRDITTGLLDDRMEFLKVRVYRGGMANTLREVLLARQDALLEELSDLRAAGKQEDDEQVGVVRDRLVWLANLLRELGVASIDLAGPDRDPRLRETP